MEEYFDYHDVPKGYIHCLNESCPDATTCLRFQVALRADAQTISFQTINPTYAAGGEGCSYFQSDQLTRFASGITHLLDKLPHSKAIEIKEILHKHFGTNTYYRIRNKKRLIRPEEQEYIRQLFVEEAVGGEPMFDEYIDKHDW